MTRARGSVRGILPALLALLLVGGCSARDALNALAPTQRLLAEADAPYGGGPRQRLSVYAPADARDAPVVVFFYGGRWQTGERGDYAWVGAALAAHGIVTVIPDYRLYPQVRFPAFAADGAAAVRWTHERIDRHGGDPRRIHVMGHSAGAHIALMLALDGRFLARGDGIGLAGAIGLAGPYDFLPPEAADLQAIFGPPERYARGQPLAFARGDAPPLLLLHGLDDTTVEPANTRTLAGAVRAAGGSVETRFYPGIDHVDLVASLSTTLDFLAPTREHVVTFVGRTRPAGAASEALAPGS